MLITPVRSGHLRPRALRRVPGNRFQRRHYDLLEVLSSHCRAPTGPGIISEPARTMLKKPKTTTYRP